MNLWLIFLTGLTTGGLSCLAVQGGLLASVIANQKEEELEFDQLDWLPVTLFLGAKLVSHILFGFFLGWLGSKLELSVTMRLIFQTIAALFMIGTALNLLEVHPIFRYLVIQPPKFFQRLVRGTSRGKALFTPVILGFLTVLVPCGITQSMEVTAISLGNPLQGALIMGAFVLGTSPLFAAVGVATAKLSETFQARFMKIAAAALIVLGVLSLNGVLVVMNSPLTIQTITHPITYFFSNERFDSLVSASSPALAQNGTQQVKIAVGNNGYSPNKITVKAGIPVQLTVSTKDVYSCASSFLMKSFNVNMQLAPTDNQTITFTPTQKGQYQFNCSMGMYKGIMEVI
jgi:sulfite exporter TauE/SafE/plastocyanin